jgi:hypothetical protein
MVKNTQGHSIFFTNEKTHENFEHEIFSKGQQNM